MSDWEHTFCRHEGLEFILHCMDGKLYFDVDYRGEWLLMDLGDEIEVEI